MVFDDVYNHHLIVYHFALGLADPATKFSKRHRLRESCENFGEVFGHLFTLDECNSVFFDSQIHGCNFGYPAGNQHIPFQPALLSR